MSQNRPRHICYKKVILSPCSTAVFFYAIFLYIRDTVVVRNSVSVVKILFSFYKVLDQKNKILLELESRARRAHRAREKALSTFVSFKLEKSTMSCVIFNRTNAIVLCCTNFHDAFFQVATFVRFFSAFHSLVKKKRNQPVSELI